MASDDGDPPPLHSNGASIAKLFMITLNNQSACMEALTAAEVVLQEYDVAGRQDYSVNMLEAKVFLLHRLITAHATTFKIVTAFWPGEFEALCARVFPTLVVRARSTCEPRAASGHPRSWTLASAFSVLFSTFATIAGWSMRVATGTTSELRSKMTCSLSRRLSRRLWPKKSVVRSLWSASNSAVGCPRCLGVLGT